MLSIELHHVKTCSLFVLTSIYVEHAPGTQKEKKKKVNAHHLSKHTTKMTGGLEKIFTYEERLNKLNIQCLANSASILMFAVVTTVKGSTEEWIKAGLAI